MKTTRLKAAIACALVGSFAVCAFSQSSPVEVPTSVNAKLVLDAAGPEQRKSLNTIYLIWCPDGSSGGSGFLLDTGVVVTNSHVVSTCTEKTLFGISTGNVRLTFSRIITDRARDLAVLVPTVKLVNGLKLAATDNPLPGTEVTTWGYPFLYNEASPLLSVGYVSGFREVTDDGNGVRHKAVKHIVVNGAFNHGNSGGPLLVAQNSEVIGVVVLTFHFYPAEVKQIIDTLLKPRGGLPFGTITRSDGSKQPLYESQVTGMVLNEFYEKTQVMIGEAVAASELVAMLKEHAADLPAPAIAPAVVRK
jgi:S1-C subfamily serine protease